jgi:hypothetical protein
LVRGDACNCNPWQQQHGGQRPFDDVMLSVIS